MGSTMEEVPALAQGEDCINLPPGFRFHPTDEEIITHYLSEKVMDKNFTARAVGEVDLNKFEPWDLPGKAKMGEKEFYFFCHKDRKYPTGMRTNRATEAGYWKATGKDKEIYRGKNCLVGMKKTLVFYRGRAPKGEKSNWVMHEYRLEGKSPQYYNFPRAAKDEWAVCRVFHKNTTPKRSPQPDDRFQRTDSFGLNSSSFVDELFASPSMPALVSPPYNNPSPSFTNDIDGGGGGGDYKGIMTPSSMPPYYIGGMEGLPADQFKGLLPNPYPNTIHPVANPPNQLAPSSSMFYPQVPPPLPPYHLIPSFTNMGYPHTERNVSGRFVSHDQSMMRALTAAHDHTTTSSALRSHCKVEQHSNQSLVSASQDTSLSTDRNMEISSKVDMGSSRSYDESLADIENMWKH